MMTQKSSGLTILLQLTSKRARFVVTALLCTAFVFGTTGCSGRSGSTTTAPAHPVGAHGSWPDATGHPEVQADADRLAIRILHNPGFVVGYDRHRGRAAWVAYRVTPVKHYTEMPRPEFQTDPRIQEPAPRRIYWGPRYDRGHMAPNYAMAQLYGASAQRASFYFSNILPQTPRLNRLLWQRLEEIEIDWLAPRLEELWVLVGPIYSGPRARVPSAFFRIWLDRTSGGDWRALALRVPQQVRGDERLDTFMVSVDAIERATGLDFFSDLPARIERAMEAGRADARAWHFAAVACKPARYADDWWDRGGIHLNFDRCD